LEGCRKNGTWGGSEDIQAFCQSFKVDVRVYSTKGVQTFRDVYAPGSEERAILHVAFHVSQVLVLVVDRRSTLRIFD
jgi:DeoR/GlpR family transcriptional regulator of sugar metabolism